MLLEAADDGDGPALGVEAVQRLLDAVASTQPSALHDGHRYALQLRIESESPAEALFSATARWHDAIRRLGLPRWSLQRAEVLTLAEFERDQGEQPAPESAAARGRSDAADDLLRRAFQDSLTGLANQELFRDGLREALASVRPESTRRAVLLVDLDRFGEVNHEHGYAVGDQVLLAMSSRFSTLGGPPGAIARLGGDEFVVLVQEPDRDAVDRAAGRLLETLRAPVTVDGRALRISASIGVALAEPGGDLDEILRRAGEGMCAAKDAGGDRIQWFVPGLALDCRRLNFDTDPAPGRMAHVLLLERAALAAAPLAGRSRRRLHLLQPAAARLRRAEHGGITRRRLGRRPPSRRPGAQPGAVPPGRGRSGAVRDRVPVAEGRR